MIHDGSVDFITLTPCRATNFNNLIFSKSATWVKTVVEVKEFAQGPQREA